MASTTLSPIAQAIVDIIDGLSVTPTVTGYLWYPGMDGIDSVPAGLVGLPIFERTEVDQPEDHISQDDWRLEFPVSILCDLSSAAYSQAQAIEITEAFIKAVDADPTLSLAPTIQEARVQRGEPVEITDEARPLVGYETTVQILAFV